MMLKDRVAVITGASSGIGAATAVAFGCQGMKVALFARRRDRLERVAQGVRSAGGQAMVAAGDVRDRHALSRLFEQALAAYGRIDVLFNNAGVGRLGWLETLDPADVRLQLEVSVLGAIEATRLVLPGMIERRSGHVIYMASLAGKIATPTYSVYAATKFALAGFGEALRREVAMWGIHVSTVFPAGVQTEWGAQAGYRRRMWRGCRGMPAQSVARAMVGLLKRPRRELILPPGARLAVWANRMLPWLGDWLALRFAQVERWPEFE